MKKNKKEGVSKETKAHVLIGLATQIEEVEKTLTILKAKETVVKEDILADLSKEQIRAFTAHGYDFSVSKSEVVVIKNENAVMAYLKKKHPEGVRESIDKSIVSHYVKGENERVPGVILEARSYLRLKKC